MKIWILSLLLFAGLSACHPIDSDAVVAPPKNGLNTLKGTWTLKYVYLSDAIDQPCYATKAPHDITLTITDQLAENSSDTYVINGQSAVNSLFGGIKIQSFDEATQTGKAVITQLGSTKMAGPEELMNCELRYFTLLSATKDFKILKDSDGQTRLHIGDFKQDIQPSRDGGLYLIYTKK